MPVFHFSCRRSQAAFDYEYKLVNLLHTYFNDNSLYSIQILCGASDWRRTVHSTLRPCAAAWVRVCGCSAPISRRASGSYVTRGLGVVGRTFHACPPHVVPGT